MKYFPTIGLEIHAELKTKSKMFCSCKNGLGLEKEPNVNICPICMGHPGTLPTANKEAVRMAVKIGLALGCEIAEESKFDRKNYFYPDLPKGYQISQFDVPICVGGKLNDIGIARIHLEEDTAKLTHALNSVLIDFNRAGVPLMELVTKPEIHSGAEARKFCEELQLALRYLNISDADMEKGLMRCEINISLSENEKLGVKVEIKNLNSFRSVEKSIDYEIKRQNELLDKKEEIIQETRGWDEKKQETFSQRKKEEAQDYRYFPEPDLSPFSLAEIKKEALADISELPVGKRKRFAEEYNLSENDIEFFVANKEIGQYFENAVSELYNLIKGGKEEAPIKLMANYLMTEFPKLTRKHEKDFKEIKISAENFAEFILIVKSGKINSSAAQEVLEEMWLKGGDPDHVIEDKKLEQVSEEGELMDVVLETIKNNKNAVDDYKKGKGNAAQFLLGQVMRQTKGRANPEMVLKILKDKLNEK